MPELPEVETIRRELYPFAVGTNITDAKFLWEGIVHNGEPDEAKRRLLNRTIKDLGRRGKYLIFSLSDNYFLLIHLKMSGSLILRKQPELPPYYTRAVISLANGWDILLVDPRKFATVIVTDRPDMVLSKLGPEPLDNKFTPKVLIEILRQHRSPIKVTLTDQESIAGIGNMYADEALFRAKINPLRPANTLSFEEAERLHRAIIEVLSKGLESKGASTRNYVRPDGNKGSAQLNFQVAHQGGQPCPCCGTPIKRITLRGRGTYFCPDCQMDSPKLF